MKIINNLPKTVNVLDIAQSTLETAKQYTDSAVASKVVTVNASNWTASSSHYVNTVAVNGIKATDYPLFGLVPSDGKLFGDDELAAYNEIIQAVAGDGQVTFYANSQPTIDLKIVLK